MTGANQPQRGVLNDPRVLFGVGAAVFILMAVLGWQKLPYGVSVMDEGMAMTDGWRLTAGDRLFPDSATNAVWLYAVFNALVFHVAPDITLLGFRQLQFLLTILSAGLLCLAVYRWTRACWYLPLAMSLFAYTGLDAAGMMSNLTYYVYPHLFLTLHLAFFLLGLKCARPVLRAGLLAASGVFLWALGFSVLPLAVTAAAPVASWIVLNRTGEVEPGFSARDLLAVLLPVGLLWLVFLSIHSGPFLEAAWEMYRSYSRDKPRSTMGPAIVLKHVLVTAGCVAVLLLGARLRTGYLLLLTGTCVALVTTLIVTAGLGAVPPYRMDVFKEVGWFSALLAVWVLTMAGRVAYRLAGRGQPVEGEPLTWLLLVPSAILVAVFATVSAQGFITFAYVAIPCSMGLSVSLVSWLKAGGHHARTVHFLVLAALLAPFYITTARADWKFTYFDRPMAELTTTVESGFLKGIRTTPANAAFFQWVERVADRYSEPGDFVIAYNWSPMIHMVARRRPAMHHSWVGMGDVVLNSGIRYMVREGRQPKLVFRLPGTTVRGDTLPLDRLVAKNMRYLDRFRSAEMFASCYIWREEAR